MDIGFKIRFTAGILACILISEAIGRESKGLNTEWGFDAIQHIVITREKVSPGDGDWGGFNNIPSPSAADYADVSQGHGVTFTSLAPLSPNSADSAVLNDGRGQVDDNSPDSSLFFAGDSDLNRVLIDLNGLKPVYQVNTYSWHKFGRKNQKHELFYNASDNPSDPKAVPLGGDWISLGSVATNYSNNSEGQVGVSYAESDRGLIVNARYLLLLVNFSPCFYGEIDVVTDSNAASKMPLSPDAKVQSMKMGRDAAYGNIEVVEGVCGNAVKFDGFTTRVVRKASQSNLLGKSFTIEGWIAPQEFSQNQTAIINQAVERETGYFLGIDKEGRLLFQANIGGKWRMCTSQSPLPILRWSYVAATFDPDKGMTVYIDGKPVGSNPAKGELVPAPEAELWIGMSLMKQAPDVHTRTGEPGYMVFDGLIDELKVHNLAFSAKQVQAAFASVKPAVAQPLQYREMPSGPKDGKRFRASYTRLNYTPEWEKQWRVGNLADVVVTFEDPRANFVFWRGTSYIPHWVSKNGIWYNNQFVERSANSDGCTGCVEPMSDKRCRFSHVRIIQSNPARTVIHWRYAPVGLNYKHPFVDPYSGQGDWVDEYYTIYPDMVGVRSMTLYSTAIDKKADWQESIIVHQPGRLPEDNIEATAVSIGNLAGDVVEYTWPGVAKKGGLFDGLPELPCIQIINLKSEIRPFMIVPPSPEVTVAKFRGHAPNSIFCCWNHWPVSQGRTTGTTAVDASRPAHSSITLWRDWEPHRSTYNSKTYLHLHGMTDKGVKDLTGLAKSWISPAAMNVLSGNCRNGGFDKEQKAYVVELKDPRKFGPLHLELKASPDSPLVHPAIVVKNWPADAMARVEAAGEKLKDEEIRTGLEQGLEGDSLVVWLRLQATKRIEIKIKPIAGK
ncbi:MAG: LamG domain-containing protein [Planctomycetes bacterium]|nr:LamG domain-containing protein [Planctomycetota bacterium]